MPPPTHIGHPGRYLLTCWAHPFVVSFLVLVLRFLCALCVVPFGLLFTGSAVRLVEIAIRWKGIVQFHILRFMLYEKSECKGKHFPPNGQRKSGKTTPEGKNSDVVPAAGDYFQAIIRLLIIIQLS